MRLLGRKRVLVLAFVSFACNTTSGPSEVAGHFALDNVNGRPVPTFMAPGPGATIVASGSVTFDKMGGAVLTERRVESTGSDLTLSENFAYKVSSGHITLDPIGLCGIPEGCTINGTISGRIVTLEIGPLVYSYRMVSLI
jgi:hypothetical protein